MKIKNLFEAAQISAAFAFGRFNPAHQGHIEVWRTVENAAARWYIGTNPSTLGPNDPLTFEQKSAWMDEIYQPITGHIAAEQSVMTLAAKIFADLGKNEVATIAYITDADDWAWSGKLLNQYNGVSGAHGYYKFAEIVHVPSPRVSSATALRDAARADDKVAFYQASGTDPKLKVAGLTYFDTVKQAVTKYPLPVKKAKKESVEEAFGYNSNKYLDNTPTKAGRDAERAAGIRPSGPQRLFSECADMLHISSNQLVALAKQFPGFPPVKSVGNKRYCDLNLFKKWVIANNIREVIAAKEWNVTEQGVEEGSEQKFKVAVDCEDDGVFTVIVSAADEREARKKAWKIVQREHETWPVAAKIVEQGVAEGLENYNGIQLSLEIQKDDEFVDDDDTDNQTIFVQATANGRELGQVVFAIDYDAKGMILVPQDLEVDERFRSQGIAATMYDYVKSKGYRIHRSSDQTPAGAGFWDKHKPGKDIWEQGVAEGAPIVVAHAPIDVRNPKKDPQSYRNQGDIVPDTKPPSTEKRGVKGRAGQRPMPKYDESDITEVSTELRNRYVTRASDDYSNANFAARISKDHPGLDDYSREQEQRAKKRAAGLNRALSDKRTGREQNVAEEQQTVAKTWDQMTSQEKLSGVKGRTAWNEQTQRYYTVFDVPVKQATDEASLATMRDYFAGDEDARDPYEITKQRLHYSKDTAEAPTKRKEFKSQWEYEQWLKQNKLRQISGVKEDEEAGEVEQQGQLIPFPAGTTKVAVSDVYDWYKLGQVISDLDDADPADFGQGAPETVIAFGSEEEEHKLLPLLQRLGLKLKDIDQPVSEACSADSLYKMLIKRK